MYKCKSCETQFTKWVGKCMCGSWDIKLVEEVVKDKNIMYSMSEEDVGEPMPLGSSINEFTRVCGLYRKSVAIIGGEPGIGKSTLMCQVAQSFSGVCLYLAGEEACASVSQRMKRVRKNLQCPENNQVIIKSFFMFEKLQGFIDEYKPSLIIIDSLHTTRLTNEDSSSHNQMREITLQISLLARMHNFCALIVSHITKDGIISGPKTIEHMVDVVLYLEGDKYGSIRLLRSIKNRFGPTNETGVFEIQEEGLVEITNPSALFISQRREGVPGSVVYVGMTGSRALLTETQALVVDSKDPEIEAIGFDPKRLKMILAILQQWCKMNFSNKNIFINFVGGMKIIDPGADLAVATAIISAYKQRSISPKVCFFGELGLTGEVRRAQEYNSRVKEALRLGFTTIYTAVGPNAAANSHVTNVNTIYDLLEMLKH